MIARYLNHFQDRLDELAGWLDARSFFSFIFWSLFISVCCSLFFFSPSFVRWDLSNPGHFETARAIQVLRQLENPFQPGLETSVQWRIFFPLLGYNLGLSQTAFLTLPFFGALLLLFLACIAALKECNSRIIAFLTCLLAATFFSHLGATGFLAGFEGWYLSGIVAIAFSLGGKTCLIVTLLCCPWMSEYFLFALPGALAVRMTRSPDGWRHVLFLTLVCLSPYMGVRMFAFLHGDPGTEQHLSSHILHAYWWLPYAPLGWFMAYRAAWLFILLAPLYVREKFGSRKARLFGLAAFLPILVLAFLASGTTGAAVVLTPVALYGIFLFVQNEPSYSIITLALVCVLNLTLPMVLVDWTKTLLKSPLIVEIGRVLL